MATPTDDVVDAEIADALGRGDSKAAYQLLADHYGSYVFTHCNKVLNDRAAAEDAMHDVLVKMMKALVKLKDPSRMRGYVKTIARNTSFDVIRARARERERVEKAAEIDDREDAALDPGGLLDKAQSEHALADCLARLSIKDREAVVNRFFRGQSYAEMAAAMDTTPDAVRVRVARALVALRACLEAKGVER